MDHARTGGGRSYKCDKALLILGFWVHVLLVASCLAPTRWREELCAAVSLSDPQVHAFLGLVPQLVPLCFVLYPLNPSLMPTRTPFFPLRYSLQPRL